MSTIGSVGSAAGSAASQVTQRMAEAAEVKGAPDHDGDADDGAGQAVRAPAPTVNMNGQKLGQIINVTG